MRPSRSRAKQEVPKGSKPQVGPRISSRWSRSPKRNPLRVQTEKIIGPRAYNANVKKMSQRFDRIVEEMKATKPMMDAYKKKMYSCEFPKVKALAPSRPVRLIPKPDPPESYSLKTSRRSSDVHAAQQMQALYESRVKFYNSGCDTRAVDKSASEADDDETSIAATYGSSSCSLLENMNIPPITDLLCDNSGYSEGDELSGADSYDDLIYQLRSKKSGSCDSYTGDPDYRLLTYALRTTSTSSGLPVNFKPDPRRKIRKPRKLRTQLRSKSVGGVIEPVNTLTLKSSVDEASVVIEKDGKPVADLKPTAAQKRNSSFRIHPQAFSSYTSIDSLAAKAKKVGVQDKKKSTNLKKT